MSVVIRTVSRVLVPFILLFSLHIITSGASTPGGGFQGGVVFGAGLILLAISFEKGVVRKMITERKNVALMSTGILVYALVGLFGISSGGSFLEYGALPLGSPAHANQLMIELVEIGVGATVAGVMYYLYSTTAGGN